MKDKNLLVLKEHNINVPNFIVVNNENDINFDFSNVDLFAVRSSCNVEDGGESSFAGQFDTLLNVKREDLIFATKKVLNSVHNENIKDYAQKHNLNMNVIIQEMIQADFSGVMFSSNPLGLLNEIVIVVGNGLGNNVVEDKIATTTYYYNKEDKTYYYDINDNSPKLNESVLTKLIDNCNEIEHIFCQPMDIEFAIKDNELYILQARPITTLNNVDNPIILDNSNIVESYPDITLPLTQSFVKKIYADIFKYLVLNITNDAALVEKMDFVFQDMVDTCNGRIYYHINNWYDILNLLPFHNKIIRIWQDMLGVNNRDVFYNIPNVSFKTRFHVTKNFIKMLINTPKEMDKFNSSMKTLFEDTDIHKKVETINSVEELLQLYETLEDGLVSKWYITLVNDMYSFIYTSLVKDKNKISNIKNLESMKPILAIQNLVDIVEKEGFSSNTYLAAKNEYIAQYGDRCLRELKLETKTYRTNPELLDDYVLEQLKLKENGLLTTFSYDENDIGNGLFVKNAKLGIKNREISRLKRSYVFGYMRAIMLRIGEIMYHNHQIDSVEDVFYLYIPELKNSTPYQTLVEKRKLEYSSYEKLPNYSRLLFSNDIFNKSISSIETSLLNNENELYGTSSSIGVVKGEVIIIKDANQMIDTTNKIIVTESTDPGWVFLIKNSLGIIAEKGSILSHTAIITRELNKPFIVNVRNATTLLKNGDIVELDTMNGVVKIIEKIG